MKTTFRGDYIRIYFWQACAMLVNLVSLLVVTPRLAGSPVLFGVYSFCMALTLFFQYSDLGFYASGTKFAAEAYARNDLAQEIRISGFVGSLTLLVSLAIGAGITAVAVNPQNLIRGLQPQHVRTAREMLLILAISSPVIAFQRMSQLAFSIRLEDYLFLQINTVASLAKIVSVFYFFGTGRYQLVGYFIFCQMMNLVSGIAGMRLVLRRYRYDLSDFRRALRLNGPVFRQLRSLGAGTFLLSLAALAYYELDAVAIAGILGAEALAAYAVGFSITSALRKLLAVVYAPFSARFNHFVGTGDADGLRIMFKRVLVAVSPAVLATVAGLLISARPLVLAWVGPEYEASVHITRCLVLGYSLGWVTFPVGSLLLARNEMRLLYVITPAVLMVYWTGVCMSAARLQMTAFLGFRVLTMGMFGAVCLIYAVRFLKQPRKAPHDRYA